MQILWKWFRNKQNSFTQRTLISWMLIPVCDKMRSMMLYLVFHKSLCTYFSVIVAPDADSLLDILESDPQSDWSNSPGPRQTGSLIWLSLALIKTAGLIRTGYVCHRFERLDMIIGWLSLQTKLAIAAKYKGLPFLQKSVRTGIWENIRSVGKVCVTVGENSLDKQERVILH